MADIYVPGISSRFNTEKIIEDLMKVERVPRDRAEKNLEGMRAEKTYWQDINRRIGNLRDSVKLLYSFQNPFNDRVVVSHDESVITGTATREAVQQERRFTVKQVAQADRFLSAPLDNSFKVESGTYTFSVGKDAISFNFRGGTLGEFIEALNRRGRDKVQAGVITVQSGTKSLLIESLVTGEANRLQFSDSAEKLALQIGMIERGNAIQNISFDNTLNGAGAEPDAGTSAAGFSVTGGVLKAEPGGKLEIPLDQAIRPLPSYELSFEALTGFIGSEAVSADPEPLPKPVLPSTGSITYGNVTIENDPSLIPDVPGDLASASKIVNDLSILSLVLSDGTTVRLPPVQDSGTFTQYKYALTQFSGDASVTSIVVDNLNTNRSIEIRNLKIADPTVSPDGFRPKTPVSSAQDALITMDGIEIRRSSNDIGDLIPGVTVTVKDTSDKSVRIKIEPDRESVKEAIISMVGNYNRLMAEINVVTRNDEGIIQELTYLSQDEQKELKERLGKFSADSSLNQLKTAMQGAASSAYTTQAYRDLALLAQIGIGTDVRRGGASSGYDASRLRGYLEIDEKTLDQMLETKLPAVQQLFGYDSDGDLIVDSGFAFAVDRLTRPYVEIGGLIALKTGSIDSRIDQEERRITSLDRQLAAKESALKKQYGEMEGAYSRMEQMSTSIDQFSQQANNNRR
ncbi:MAG: flagellar filament capping protein FliD [Treponema sp.]|jgi:flagellar hook-associated protein 2|nr:flagellar filament capping protein FliD [Treponema sp.]